MITGLNLAALFIGTPWYERKKQMLTDSQEVSDTLAQKEAVLKELREEEGWNEKRAVALEAMYDSLEGSVRDLEEGVKGVHSMDVWVAKFGVAVDQV